PTQVEQIAHHDHLGQDCRLDQGEPVIRELDLILGQDQAAIPKERHQEKGQIPEIDAVLVQFVDDRPLPSGRFRLHVRIPLLAVPFRLPLGSPALPSAQGHGGWSAAMPLFRSVDQLTFFTAGIVHDPSMIEGLLSLGQYIRSIKTNFPGGAGSQLDSLAAPGDSFWIYTSTDPSGLALRSCRALIE